MVKNLNKQVYDYSKNMNYKFLGNKPISTVSIVNNLVPARKNCEVCINPKSYRIRRDTLGEFDEYKERD